MIGSTDFGDASKTIQSALRGVNALRRLFEAKRYAC